MGKNIEIIINGKKITEITPNDSGENKPFHLTIQVVNEPLTPDTPPKPDRTLDELLKDKEQEAVPLWRKIFTGCLLAIVIFFILFLSIL